MIRWDDSMGHFTYYSELVNQWLGLGGGQIGDRDLDTRVQYEASLKYGRRHYLYVRG